MITGLGIDVIQNERIRESIERFGDRFLNRIYTEAEMEYCRKCAQPEIHYAAAPSPPQRPLSSSMEALLLPHGSAGSSLPSLAA